MDYILIDVKLHELLSYFTVPTPVDDFGNVF